MNGGNWFGICCNEPCCGYKFVRSASACPTWLVLGSVDIPSAFLWLSVGCSLPAPFDDEPRMISLRSGVGVVEDVAEAVACPGPVGGRTRCKERASD